MNCNTELTKNYAEERRTKDCEGKSQGNGEFAVLEERPKREP